MGGRSAAYDADIAFTRRLEKMEFILKNIRHLKTVDKELLVWLAVTRWLVRNNNYNLAALVFEEYKSLSLRLTGGSKEDALGIADDLLSKEWMEELLKGA